MGESEYPMEQMSEGNEWKKKSPSHLQKRDTVGASSDLDSE